jgi:hypothetical protein
MLFPVVVAKYNNDSPPPRGGQVYKLPPGGATQRCSPERALGRALARTEVWQWGNPELEFVIPVQALARASRRADWNPSPLSFQYKR